MSEVETSSTGFRRGNKQRSSLPIVRTTSKTMERPLGKKTSYFCSILLPNTHLPGFSLSASTIWDLRKTYLVNFGLLKTKIRFCWLVKKSVQQKNDPREFRIQKCDIFINCSYSFDCSWLEKLGRPLVSFKYENIHINIEIEWVYNFPFEDITANTFEINLTHTTGNFVFIINMGNSPHFTYINNIWKNYWD